MLVFCYAKKETIFYFSIITFKHIVFLSPYPFKRAKKRQDLKVLPYMSSYLTHYSAVGVSSVEGASVDGVSAAAAAFLGAAGALLRRVFLAGSAAVDIELP